MYLVMELVFCSYCYLLYVNAKKRKREYVLNELSTGSRTQLPPTRDVFQETKLVKGNPHNAQYLHHLDQCTTLAESSSSGELHTPVWSTAAACCQEVSSTPQPI